MSDSVLRQLADLAAMPIAALRDRWRTLYGTEPPATYKRAYLIRRLSYRVQELAYGGLSEDARDQLRQIAAADDFGVKARRARRLRRHREGPVAGTRLIRDWNGRRYEVTATRDGFEFEGRRFRTLSAIAKAITGAHHSGPRFFGLVRQAKEAT
jgi:hypothetical protein